MKIITRKEAIKRGLKKYFTGKPCKYGHVSERFVSHFRCVMCKSETAKAYQRENKEKIAEYKKTYRQENKEKIAAYDKAYQKANREKVAEYKKTHYQANREKFIEYQKAYREANKES